MIILLFAGSLVFSAVPVWAKKPITITIYSETTGVDITGFEVLKSGLVKLSMTVTQKWIGAWEGINIMTVTAIARPPKEGLSLNTVKAFGTFTSTSGDMEGTVYHRMRNNFYMDASGNALDYFSNRITLLRGTGDFENIHGQGTVDEPVPGEGGVIDFKVHFDP
jgi:hypothetical protein